MIIKFLKKTLHLWTYKIEKLEFILGERDKSPIPFGIKNAYTEKIEREGE